VRDLDLLETRYAATRAAKPVEPAQIRGEWILL
jgi:hypothetical protein